MGSCINIFIHCILFYIYTYSTLYDFAYVADPKRNIYVNNVASKLMYLTIWSLIVQTVYFGYSVVNDLVGTNLKPEDPPSKRSTLQKFRDIFAASVVFPIGCFVVMSFWALYAIDRELVFPKRLDAIVPSWLNHIMHSTVIVFLLLEKFCVYHHYPRRNTGLMCTVGFAGLYQLWILWVAFHADIWVYPVLAVLSWPGRLMFFAICWVILIALYITGEKITQLVWRSGKVTPVTKKID